MFSLSRKSPTFVTGPALPCRTASSNRGNRCLPVATVASSSVASVTIDNNRQDGVSVLRLTGEDKPCLLAELVAAVSASGFKPTRINMLELVADQPAVSEFVLDSQVTESDIEALKAKVQDVWASAPAHVPVVETTGDPELVAFDSREMIKIPDEAIERGIFCNVDSSAHADWTTLTIICPAGGDVAQKMMAAISTLKNNIIFATVRSTEPTDSGVAPDIYLLQTLGGKPLPENERVELHNALVKILLA